MVTLGVVFLSLLSRGHLLCMYLGQYTRKCLTVSLGCLHARHLRLLTLLNL